MSPRRVIWGVLALALVFRLVVALVVRVDRSPSSDEAILVGLATSLADGRGYQVADGMYWTNQPTLIQSPGWPVLLSAVYRVTPASTRWPVARLFAILWDAVNAVLLIVLARRLGCGLAAAGVAGVLYALNPVAAGVAAGISRDSAGIAFMLLFIVAVTGRDSLRSPSAFLAGLLLGYACLIRSNWYLIGLCFCAGVLWMGRHEFKRTVLLLVLFVAGLALPQAPWLVRNAIVFGKFPVLGAGGGETLYGGNNEVSARLGGKYWGYFVFPDQIPGETPLRALASRMTELQVDEYYRHKAMEWLSTHPRQIPGLVLGKIVRAYVPVPRTRGVAVLAGSAYRWVIYAFATAAVWALWQRRVRIPGVSAAALGAVVLAQLATVVLFCGYFRYAAPSELLLSIPAGWAVASRAPWFRV